MREVDLASVLEHFWVRKHVWLVEKALDEGLVTRVIQVLLRFLHSPWLAEVDPGLQSAVWQWYTHGVCLSQSRHCRMLTAFSVTIFEATC